MNFAFEKSCVQLFYINKNKTGPPIPVASAVLVNIRGYFLITARHVFDGIQMNELCVFTSPDKLTHLYGDLGYYKSVSETDNIDLAVLKLDLQLFQIFSEAFEFLHYKNILLSGAYNLNSMYSFYGYISKQTTRVEKYFNTNSFGMTTKIKQLKKINSLGYNENENLLLVYHRRKQNYIGEEQNVIGPNSLKGLSGGGVWETIPHHTIQGRYFLCLQES